MAKYFGKIGFSVQRETSPGVWTDVIEERPYYGDILSNSRRFDVRDEINPNFTLNNVFSVVTDTYFHEHFPAMRYLTYLGTKFEITSVDLDRPRATISVGGVYVAGGTPTDTSD